MRPKNLLPKERKINPKSLANLKPPQKGEVRNPLGINRGRIYSDRYEEIANTPLPEIIREKFNTQLGQEILPKGSTWAQANAIRQHIKAVLEGDTGAAREITDRVEGKPRQRMEITGAEGVPLMAGNLDLTNMTDEQLKTRQQELLKVIERGKSVPDEEA